MRTRLVLLLLWLAIGLALAATAAAAPSSQPAFGGVGLQVVPTIEGDLVILRVVEGTPAEQLGLRPGDLIFQVDDFVLKGSDFGKVVAEHLWGPVDSLVILHYRRPGEAGQHQLRLRRTNLDPKLTVSPSARPPLPREPGVRNR